MFLLSVIYKIGGTGDDKDSGSRVLVHFHMFSHLTDWNKETIISGNDLRFSHMLSAHEQPA